MFIDHNDYESLGSLKERFDIHNWLKEKFNLRNTPTKKELKEKELEEIIDIFRDYVNGREYIMYGIRTRSDNDPKMLSTRNERRLEAEGFYVENWVKGKIDYKELIGFQRI